jgi:hypothetical protein
VRILEVTVVVDGGQLPPYEYSEALSDFALSRVLVA